MQERTARRINIIEHQTGSNACAITSLDGHSVHSGIKLVSWHMHMWVLMSAEPAAGYIKDIHRQLA